MTDNEIIKALNYCCGNIGYNDEECNKDMCYQVALPESRDGDVRWCKQWLIKDALDLINRQKAEIERLEQIVEQQDKEILTLQKRIINWRADIDYRPEDIKSEAIKEFADSVKQELRFYYHNQENVRVISIMNHIDNLAKEMTE